MRKRANSVASSEHCDMIGGTVTVERVQRSRERNREHARKTRMRKKEQLRGLQQRIKSLKDESAFLRAALQDCATAACLLNINKLVGIEKEKLQEDSDAESGCSAPLQSSLHPLPVTPPGGFEISTSLADVLVTTAATVIPDDDLDDLTCDYGARKRKRIVSLSGECDFDEEDHELAYGSNSAAKNKSLNLALERLAAEMKRPNINWKNGTYLCPATKTEKPLSEDELEKLRKERNRMHAKMTRDRKKLFVASIEEAISRLASDNEKMRQVLGKNAEVLAYSKEQERHWNQMRGDDDDRYSIGGYSDDNGEIEELHSFPSAVSTASPVSSPPSLSSSPSFLTTWSKVLDSTSRL
ncbi:hypothetical protein TrST_g8234 [Triparma strigata]|uniref:BZIP domain-containing protein n=1 Tax=Triparma strigata TaxID=1606541 RepID=A0A9W6ZCM5_9STRA|nr:hypothetical protein TrST_g8234 [Triparma strigata]